jgi:hypothetical protein
VGHSLSGLASLKIQSSRRVSGKDLCGFQKCGRAAGESGTKCLLRIWSSLTHVLINIILLVLLY